MAPERWTLSEKIDNYETPYDVLKEYARSLAKDTNNLFLGDVVHTILEDGSTVTAFYIVVPNLKNYSYRLIEAESKTFDNLYPTTVRLFGLADKNLTESIASSDKDLRSCLDIFIKHPITDGILRSLKTQIDIYNDFNDLGI